MKTETFLLERNSSSLRDRVRKSPGTYEWGVLVLGAFSWMWTWTKNKVVKKWSPSATMDTATSWWFSQQTLYRPHDPPPPAGKITNVPISERWPVYWRRCELERFVLGSVLSLLGCVPNSLGDRGQSYVDKTWILVTESNRDSEQSASTCEEGSRVPSPLCIPHIYYMSTRDAYDEMCSKSTWDFSKSE